MKRVCFRRLRSYLLAWMFLSCLGLPASAQIAIDFESIPGGTPADQVAISTQYFARHGITFSLEGGGTPFLERVGAVDSGHGFYNWEFNSFDIEATGAGATLGSFFLRFGTATFSPTPGPVLVIEFASPVRQASAQIWDIDAAQGGTNGFEAWTVRALDANGAVVDTQISPNGIDESLPSSLNGKPWTWSFARANNDIHAIEFEFSGTANVVGLAFDNLSASDATPVPITTWGFWVLAAMLAAVGIGNLLPTKASISTTGQGS